MLSAYRIVWIFVIFDLPTGTKKQRKEAFDFRKNLLKDGFTMMQYSVYVRHCSNGSNADTHVGRVRGFLPSYGKVSILCVTDRQYGNIINFFAAKEKRLSDGPKQLEIF